MGDDRERGRNGNEEVRAQHLTPTAVSNCSQGGYEMLRRQHDGRLSCGAMQQGEPGKEGATMTECLPSTSGHLLHFFFLL